MKLFSIILISATTLAFATPPKPTPSFSHHRSPTPRPSPTATAKPSPTATTTTTPTPTASVSGPKPFASGIYDLLPVPNDGDPGDISAKPFLTNANVDGARLRTGANKCEPSKSTFDWTIIDKAKASCSAHGKKLAVSVSWGLKSPTWIYSNGCTKFTPIQVDGDGTDMPLPWDTTFQGYLHDFIIALGARYDGDPDISEVIITGFMMHNENHFVMTAEDETKLNTLAPSGNARTDWLAAAKTITGWWAASFPKTPIVFTTARPFPDDTADQNALENYGETTYPKHFGTMSAYGKAHDPPYVSPAKKSYPKGDQALDAQQPALGLLEAGVEKGDQKYEMYEPVINDPANQSTLAAEKIKLKANLP